MNKLFESAFKHSAIGMALISLEGKWLRVNRSICEIVGLSESELLQTDFQSITHPDDLEKDLEYVQQMLQGQLSTYTMDKRYINKNNQIVWVTLTVSLIRGESNQPEYFVSQIQDITEKKRQECELEQTRRHEAQKARLASLGELAASIVHEINNPLSVISGQAELIEHYLKAKVLDKDKMSRGVTSINLMIDRLKIIIKGIKNYTRIAQDDEFILTDIDSLFKEVEVLMRDKIIKNKVDLSFMIKSVTKEFCCQQVQISQVIINLISNSVDAISSDVDRWIKVSFDEQLDYYRICVEDSGVGVSKDIQESIMEPLFTTKPAGEGSGLGLSISKNILHGHMGSLELDTNGVNTKFIMLISKELKAKLAA